MFLLRGTVATLAAFFLAYAALSGILVCVWRMAEKRQAIRSAAALNADKSFFSAAPGVRAACIMANLSTDCGVHSRKNKLRAAIVRRLR